MQQTFIIANWKSQKSEKTIKEWFDKIGQSISYKDKEIIICPAFPYLALTKALIKERQMPFKVGAQDISHVAEGAYTGAVSGLQIADYAEYVIIGHSERRMYFAETEEILAEKVALAKKYGVIPIYCVQSEETPIPDVSLVAYEPVWAIGSGNAETPENASDIAHMIMKKHTNVKVLYGGSVTDKNIAAFTKQEHIHGVLVGTASLRSEEFAKLIQNA